MILKCKIKVNIQFRKYNIVNYNINYCPVGTAD